MKDPIFVTGNARQGTTFVQWFLCQHPNIFIHGQELIPWRNLITFYMDLVNKGIEIEKRNKNQKYDIPHWAGSGQEKTTEIFKNLLYDYFSGQGEHRSKWGLKSLWLPGDPRLVEKIQLIYPQPKWIICCRDPFTSYESQKNTFVNNQDITEWLRNWVQNIRFSKREDAFLIQLDKLNEATPEQRIDKFNQLLQFLEEEPCDETNNFIKKWEIVHKVIPDHVRRYELELDTKNEKIKFFPGLAEYMEELGYI